MKTFWLCGRKSKVDIATGATRVGFLMFTEAVKTKSVDISTLDSFFHASLSNFVKFSIMENDEDSFASIFVRKFHASFGDFEIAWEWIINKICSIKQKYQPIAKSSLTKKLKPSKTFDFFKNHSKERLWIELYRLSISPAIISKIWDDPKARKKVLINFLLLPDGERENFARWD